MPRYGNINERRHQLHEVIRLSGDEFGCKWFGYALIIKVSIPKERIQVYFIDNDEYFEKQHLLMKMVCILIMMNVLSFFAKGVVETVKIKLGSWYYSCSWLDGGNVANLHDF
jgi:starch synthase